MNTKPHTSNSRLEKSRLRSQIKRAIEELSQWEKDALASRALRGVMRLGRIRNARTIGLFMSDSLEIPTQKFFELFISSGKRVFYPKVEGDQLNFHEVRALSELQNGYRGILEPKKSRPFRGALDVCFVPGIAFDSKGNRLGRGKGFYDRFLASFPSPKCKIGLGFHFQLLPSIPIEHHDQSLNFVVTNEVCIFAG